MIKFPFTSMQQFNLDWIMQQLHKMLQFMPMNGVAGDVLQRNVDGAAWMPLTSVSLDIHSMSTIPEVEGADELAIYDNSLQGNYKGTVADILALVPSPPVSSVNGQTGTVVLDAGDVGALPDTYAAPVDSVNGQTGAVVLDAADVGAMPDTYAAPVDSVNGQTGTVLLSIPSDTSDLTNTAGFVDAAGAAAAAPVQSVNGQTGAVIVSGGSGIDILGGTSGSCTLASHAGIGQASDLDQLNWRLSADKKWLMLYGFFTIVFNTTGDYTLIDLGGPSLNPTGATAYYYKGAATLVNTSGEVNYYASRGSSILRLSNNVIRISINDPGATGTYTVIIHPVLLQVDA